MALLLFQALPEGLPASVEPAQVGAALRVPPEGGLWPCCRAVSLGRGRLCPSGGERLALGCGVRLGWQGWEPAWCARGLLGRGEEALGGLPEVWGALLAKVKLEEMQRPEFGGTCVSWGCRSGSRIQARVSAPLGGALYGRGGAGHEEGVD